MRRPHTGAEWALAALYAFTAIAVLGYGVFALHPERMPRIPWVLSFYTLSFRFFAQAHILVAAVVLAVPLVRRVRWRWVPALAIVFVLSFAAEFLSTGYGFPFGDYRYTALLGPRLGGRVPFVIPLSWFLMALPAFGLARAAFSRHAVARIGFAALLLAVWDLALDPAMSHLTAYWIWEESGSYYGMPWTNLVGWYGTGLVLMAALELLGVAGWVGRLETRWLAGYYGAVLLMPLGMMVAAGLWSGVALTILALTGSLVLSRGAVRKAQEPGVEAIPLTAVEQP